MCEIIRKTRDVSRTISLEFCNIKLFRQNFGSLAGASLRESLSLATGSFGDISVLREVL